MKKILVFMVILVFTGLSYALDYSYKIVGGKDVTGNNYPSTVVLFDRGSYAEHWKGQYCGGTYIGNGWVLTAAHCVYTNIHNFNGEYWELDESMILYGSSDIWQAKQAWYDRAYIHPNYDDASNLNDIALLKLKTDINIPAGRLITNDILSLAAPGTMGTAVGWGSMSSVLEWTPDMEFPEVMQEVDLPIRSEAECKEQFGDWTVFYSSTCAGYVIGAEDKGVCFGDSGGPLYVKDHAGVPYVTGIANWVTGCGNKGSYGVFARVSMYEDWIEHVKDGTAVRRYRMINSPEAEPIGVSIDNGQFPIGYGVNPIDLKYCYEWNRGNTELMSMAKFDLQLEAVNGSVTISLLTVTIGADEFYLKRADGSAYDFVSGTKAWTVGKRAYINVADNGAYDLDSRQGYVRVVVVKSDIQHYLSESNPMWESNHCFDDAGGNSGEGDGDDPIPAGVFDAPVGAHTYSYPDRDDTIRGFEPGISRPIAVYRTRDKLKVDIDVTEYKTPVDLYFAIAAPAINPNDIYLVVDEGRGVRLLSQGLAPWVRNTKGDLRQSFELDIASLPLGDYSWYLLVSPAGSNPARDGNYYLWATTYHRF